jgi:hypothetical protein
MGSVFAGERLNHLIDEPSGKSKECNDKIMKVCLFQPMKVCLLFDLMQNCDITTPRIRNT